MDKKTPILDFSKLSQEQMKIADMVIEAAEAYKIDPNLLLAQAFRESGFRHIPSEDPSSDAFGVMQIRPSTGKLNKLGDIRDLRTNVYGGAQLMRNYLDEYKSPEAALLAYHQGPGVADIYIKSKGDLKAVGPKGLDYVIDIGNNGGFGRPAKSEESTKEENPNNPFAVGVPLADKARESSQETDTTTEPPPPTTLLEKASALANEINPAAAAAVGAVANVAGPTFSKPILSPAEEAFKSAQDKLELARRNLNAVSPPLDEPPMSRQSLEDTYRTSQDEMERLKNEQRLAQERLRGLPRVAPEVDVLAPSSPPDSPSRTKAGASGAVNFVNAMSDDVPEVLANQALNMRKDNPRGGQAIIDANTRAIQKQADLGMSDYGMTRTEGGMQMILPPTTLAERQADIDRQSQASQAELAQRNEQARLQQQAQAQQLEQQRLAYEADLERLRQERAEAGRRLNETSGQIKKVTPLKKAVTTAETNEELARRKLGRAPEPSTPAGRAAVNVGKATGRTVVGGLAGAAGVMSLQEALERFKAGDTSEGVLKIIQASSAAAMLTPPLNKTLSRTRKTGALGAIGSYGYDFGRGLLRDAPPKE